jgi:PAS domain S-box-containing protein
MERTELPSLARHLPDPHLFFDPSSGEIVDATRRFRELAGHDGDRLQGRPVDLVFPGSDDGRTGIERQVEVAREEGPQRFDATLRRADGTGLPVEVALSLAPIGGEECVVAAVRDASDRRAYERSLEEYRRRLDGAMLAGDLAWWELDLETGAVTFHEQKADALGYSPDDFDHYEDFTELVHPEDYERTMAAMEDHLAGEAERYDVEYRIRDADGEYRWFHDVGGVTERAPDGTPREVTGVVVDVTRRMEAAAELERTTEQLVLLNRIVRHDVANDMTIARGWLELLREDLPPEQREQVDRVLEAVEHATRLTESLRDLIRVVAEEGDVEVHPVDLSAYVGNAVEQVEAEAGRVDVTLGEVPDAQVRANPMLSSVFGNLLRNAVEHSDRDEPRIEVTAVDRGDAVEVRVADDGPGVPEERKPSLFTFDDDGGSVGLYLVETLVTSYGGDVWVTDNEPRGAVFHVTLPRAE